MVRIIEAPDKPYFFLFIFFMITIFICLTWQHIYNTDPTNISYNTYNTNHNNYIYIINNTYFTYNTKITYNDHATWKKKNTLI